jgi:hypothetical protein
MDEREVRITSNLATSTLNLSDLQEVKQEYPGEWRTRSYEKIIYGGTKDDIPIHVENYPQGEIWYMKRRLVPDKKDVNYFRRYGCTYKHSIEETAPTQIPDHYKEISRRVITEESLYVTSTECLLLLRVEETAAGTKVVVIEMEAHEISAKFRAFFRNIMMIISGTDNLYVVNDFAHFIEEHNTMLGLPLAKKLIKNYHVKPIEVSLTTQRWFGTTRWNVTNKGDGLRGQIVITKGGIWFMQDNGRRVNLLTSSLPHRVSPAIFDVEKIDDWRDASRRRYNFVPFDVLAIDKFPRVNTMQHKQRVAQFRSYSVFFASTGIINWHIKKFFDCGISRSDWFSAVESALFSDPPFATDGLIFTNEYSGSRIIYDKSGSKKPYPLPIKWKPPQSSTVDLLFRDNILYFGRDIPVPDKYWRDSNLSILENGTIYEFSIIQMGQLSATRKRLDKDRANSERVGLMLLENHESLLTEDGILGRNDQFYRKYHNMIKRELLEDFKGESFLIDIGAGKGSMLSSYGQFRRVLAIEPNQDHVDEFISRAEGKDIVVIKAGEPISLNHHIVLIIGTWEECAPVILRDVPRDSVSIVSMFYTLQFMNSTELTYLAQLANHSPQMSIIGIAVEKSLMKGEINLGEDGIIYRDNDKLVLDITTATVTNQVESLIDITDTLNRITTNHVQLTDATRQSFLLRGGYLEWSKIYRIFVIDRRISTGQRLISGEKRLFSHKNREMMEIGAKSIHHSILLAISPNYARGKIADAEADEWYNEIVKSIKGPTTPETILQVIADVCHITIIIIGQNKTERFHGRKAKLLIALRGNTTHANLLTFIAPVGLLTVLPLRELSAF